MAYLTQLFSFTLQNLRQNIICDTNNIAKVCVRHASKKSSTSTRIKPGHPRPKHRGCKVQDGHYVQPGHLLVTQRTTRFHPGLYVGFGKNGTLFAMEPGKVVVTCEKINPNLEHTWIVGNYAGREHQVIYKKHYNIIPEPQHQCFKLIGRL